MISEAQIAREFPGLNQYVHDKSLVYLDSAATSQLPVSVLSKVTEYYETSHSNVHRGVHTLGDRASSLYEAARSTVAAFINARLTENIVFTSGTTEAINLVAQSYGWEHIEQGDGILVTELEHHSNFVPWQQLALQKGAEFHIVSLDEEWQVNREQYRDILSRGNIKLVALAHASNVLGTILPIKEMIREAHDAGSVVLVDAAQSAPHLQIDVQDLDVDFLAVSGHKMLGPTGIGFLYAKQHLLETMSPYKFGGGMVGLVRDQGTTWGQGPAKFEAGTPNISGAVGLAAGIDFLNQIGMQAIYNHEQKLLDYSFERLQEIDGLILYGPRGPRTGVISFNVEGVHAHDVATILDQQGVEIRAGHHCAQPLHRKLCVAATNRASFYLYNNEQDVDRFVQSLLLVKGIFHRA